MRPQSVPAVVGVIKAAVVKEVGMRQNDQRLRRVILSRLYDHLEQEYSVAWPRETFVSGGVTRHEVDAALAFKSDPCLDELRTALDRLDRGTYGVCIACKRKIPLGSLIANPAQRICSACEEAFTHAGLHTLHHGAVL